MLVGALGCNLAWGIIDGVLYVLAAVFERGRLRRIRFNLAHATSDAEAHQVIAEELDESLAPVTDDATRRHLYANVLEHVRSTQPVPNRVRREDVMGGLAAGWVVLACSFPAVLPFLVLDDPRLALRVSNVILLGLLFYAGWRAARLTLAKPWIAGTTFLLVGFLLVALAIPLGG
jgi:VIT1/CCC1 family predicted Fe2+/Mn2+ transporter